MPASQLRRKRRLTTRISPEEELASILHYNIKNITPLTETQRETFECFFSDKNLLLHGYAGTGKSLISLYLLLKEFAENLGKYDKIVIIKSIVPVRDIGFLPGSAKEKAEIYELPYKNMVGELIKKSDAYFYLKQKGIIDFIPTSFIRGITLDNCLVLVDEIQNMDFDELSSVITRIGNNCRIILCGDYHQSDLRFKESKKKDDVLTFMKIIKRMEKNFSSIEFRIDDIVRSGLVKEYLLTAYEMGLTI